MKFGLFSGILWLLDTVVLGIALAMAPYFWHGGRRRLRQHCQLLHPRCGMRHLATHLHGRSRSSQGHRCGPQDQERPRGHARRPARWPHWHDGLRHRHQQHWPRLHCHHLCLLSRTRSAAVLYPAQGAHECQADCGTHRCPARCYGHGRHLCRRLRDGQHDAWPRRGRPRRHWLGFRSRPVRLGHEG